MKTSINWLGNGSVRIENAADLTREIRLLEQRCYEKEEDLKMLLGEVKESVKPINIIKSALPPSLSLLAPVLKKGIVGNAIGLAAGKLFQRIFRKKKKLKI